MKCPACFNELTEVEVGGVAVDVCQNGCAGIWLDAFELQRLDEKHEIAGNHLLHLHRDPAATVDHSRKRECPRCPNIKLKRHFFSTKRRVEVDLCPNCGGYWLDAGELAAIRAENTRAAELEEARKPTISSEFIRYLYRLQQKHRNEPGSAESP
jgi:hypothetical protein